MRKTCVGGTAVLSLLALSSAFITGAGQKQQRQAVRVPAADALPRVEVERGKVPRAATGVFQVDVRFKAKPGRHQWMVRAQVLDESGKTPRVVWTSPRRAPGSHYSLGGTGIVSEVMRGGNAASISSHMYQQQYDWRFRRGEGAPGRLTFVVEAVLLPETSTSRENAALLAPIRDVTEAEIATARRKPDARYFRKSLKLDARDDGKHVY